MASAKAGLDAAMKQMEYTKVTSPIDGVIELKSVEDHGQTAPTSPAYVVSNKEIMVVKFGVPASALEHMTVGDQVTIENGGRTYTGSVVEVGSRDGLAGTLAHTHRFAVAHQVDHLHQHNVQIFAVQADSIHDEDENIAVLYKPTHLLCHSDRTGDANLVDAFTQYLAEKGELRMHTS